MQKSQEVQKIVMIEGVLTWTLRSSCYTVCGPSRPQSMRKIDTIHRYYLYVFGQSVLTMLSMSVVV